MKQLFSFLIRWIFILGVIYVLIAGMVALFQDHLIFRPRPLTESQDTRAAKRAGATKQTITNDGKVLHAFFVPAEESDGAPATLPTLVYFGGNGEDLSSTALSLHYVNNAGWNTVFCFYRGYGRSEGDPSAEAFTEDAIAWMAAIAKMDTVDSQRLVVWGRSLGTGVAVQAALRGTPRAKAMILTSPFTRLRDAAQHRFSWLPTQWLLRHKLDSIDLVNETPTAERPRLLVLHGEKDQTIPISQGRDLVQAFGPKANIVEFPSSGHNDLGSGDRYHESVLSLLKTL